ncbi:MAG: epoxyqueuosine reductase QueH [Clostridiales bacterium]|nr:epoxyqueuosine reductase QueH [Clostridiales bacterium]
MNRRNYQKELEKIIAVCEGKSRVPRLLLHACCAPCSSYVLEYLSRYFDITVFYYNPNISPAQEYEKRVAELRRLIGEMPLERPVRLEIGAYEPERFYEISRGYEAEPEGGERCFRCYRLRLEETARMAAAGGYDYFATTLTISPLKNAQKLNEIGEEVAEIYDVVHLPSDFKKKNGYKRSIELSGEYRLYRQNFCGCVFSRPEARGVQKSGE